MRQYLLKRLLLIPPTLFGILLISFFITRFVPGGPLEQALEAKRAAAEKRGGRVSGDSGSGSLSPEEVSKMKELYGLDRPVIPGFFEWLGVKTRELSPKSSVTFQPGETGSKPVTIVIPVKTESKDTDGAVRKIDKGPALFVFEATVHLDRDLNPTLEFPKNLPALVADWSSKQGVNPDKVDVDAADWTAVVATPDYDNPTGLTWVRSLLLANDVPPDKNKPVRIRVFSTGFAGILQGNFGVSFIHSRPVVDVIFSKMPVSLMFGVASLFISYALAVPLGVMKAMKHGGTFDSVSSFLMFFFYAVPGFVLATIMLFFFAFKLEWLPHSGIHGPNFETLGYWGRLLDVARHMIMPLFALSISQLAFMTLLMKNSLMDNLGSDYVRTAVAKGVSYRKAVLRHAFRNSLVPLATGFGTNITVIFTGSFLIEQVFDIDGFGMLSFRSLVGRDYPIFMANLLFASLLLLIGNVLSDICVALVDPRIRFEK